MSDNNLIDNSEVIKVSFWNRLLTSAYYSGIIVLVTYSLVLGCILFYTTCGFILGTLNDSFFNILWSRLVFVAQAQVELFDKDSKYQLKLWRIFALIDFFIFLWLLITMPETKRVKRK